MNIYITESSHYSKKALNIYKKFGCNLFFNIDKDQIGSIDCLLVRLGTRLDSSFLKPFLNLKYIISPTTALTHIDIDECKSRKIKVISLRDCKKDLSKITSSSEHALALSLSLVRSLPNYFEQSKNGIWDRYTYPIRELSSLNIGIIGLGRIGEKLFNIYRTIGSNVNWFDINKSSKYSNYYLDKNQLIQESDLIIISASYNKGDDPIISNKEVYLFDKNKYLVNISRGAVISDSALENLFRTNKLFGFATDVITQEDHNQSVSSSIIYKLMEEGFNIIVTPHIGGAAKEAMGKTEVFVAQKFIKIIK